MRQFIDHMPRASNQRQLVASSRQATGDCGSQTETNANDKRDTTHSSNLHTNIRCFLLVLRAPPQKQRRESRTRREAACDLRNKCLFYLLASLSRATANRLTLMKIKIMFVLLTAFLVPASRLAAQTEAAVPNKSSTKRVAFAQSCFWTGEMKLGQIEGVVRTEAGYLKGREVTLVDYSPERISLVGPGRLASPIQSISTREHSAGSREFRVGSHSMELIASRPRAIKRSQSRAHRFPVCS